MTAGAGYYPLDERQRDRRARVELRDAGATLRGLGAYAHRTLVDVQDLASVDSREAKLTDALQHIESHCHTACEAITTIDDD